MLNYLKKMLKRTWAATNPQNILELFTIVVSGVTNYYFSAGDGVMRIATAVLTSTGVVALGATCAKQVYDKHKELMSFVGEKMLEFFPDKYHNIRIKIYAGTKVGVLAGFVLLVGYDVCVYYKVPAVVNGIIAFLTMCAFPVSKKYITGVLAHTIDKYTKLLSNRPLREILDMIDKTSLKNRENISFSVVTQLCESPWLRLQIISDQIEEQNKALQALNQQQQTSNSDFQKINKEIDEKQFNILIGLKNKLLKENFPQNVEVQRKACTQSWQQLQQEGQPKAEMFTDNEIPPSVEICRYLLENIATNEQIFKSIVDIIEKVIDEASKPEDVPEPLRYHYSMYNNIKATQGMVQAKTILTAEIRSHALGGAYLSYILADEYLIDANLSTIFREIWVQLITPNPHKKIEEERFPQKLKKQLETFIENLRELQQQLQRGLPETSSETSGSSESGADESARLILLEQDVSQPLKIAQQFIATINETDINLVIKELLSITKQISKSKTGLQALHGKLLSCNFSHTDENIIQKLHSSLLDLSEQPLPKTMIGQTIAFMDKKILSLVKQRQKLVKYNNGLQNKVSEIIKFQDLVFSLMDSSIKKIVDLLGEITAIKKDMLSLSSDLQPQELLDKIDDIMNKSSQLKKFLGELKVLESLTNIEQEYVKWLADFNAPIPSTSKQTIKTKRNFVNLQAGLGQNFCIFRSKEQGEQIPCTEEEEQREQIPPDTKMYYNDIP